MISHKQATRRRRNRSIVRFAWVGAMAGTGVGLLVQLIEGGQLAPHLIRGALVGFAIGLGVGFGEESFFFGRRRWRSYHLATATRVGLYSLLVAVALIVVNAAGSSSGGTLGARALTYVGTPGFLRDAMLAVLVAAMGTAYLEVRRLHNPGEIRRFLFGRYRIPVEEERVFLFADLVDSTGLAERLGPRTYSAFVSDAFRDLSEAILAWRGEVYQYVGDQVVVSWPSDAGTRDASALRCFAQMTRDLERRSTVYEARYGAAPRFRAGIHAGPVVTTWVGLAKIELAFHGDTLNAAARIQSSAQSHGADLLVSAPTLRQMAGAEDFPVRSVGPVELRGREERVELYAVSVRE
ncbi:MAG: adenylate/guanylate cyclase domain-containing protein [Gemmatimonadota bacterium]